MTAADAHALFAKILGPPAKLDDGGDAHWTFSPTGAEGRSTAQLELRDTQGKITGIAEVEFQLWQPGPDLARYQLLAEGIRAAMPDLIARGGELAINDLLEMELLFTSLQSADEIRRALTELPAKAAALAPRAVEKLARKHGLPPLTDAEAMRAIFELESDGTVEELQAAAETLVRRAKLDVVPYLIRILERWKQLLDENPGGIWFTDDDQNAHLLLARIILPLASKGETPEDRRHFLTLWESGLFNPE